MLCMLAPANLRSLVPRRCIQVTAAPSGVVAVVVAVAFAILGSIPHIKGGRQRRGVFRRSIYGVTRVW